MALAFLGVLSGGGCTGSAHPDWAEEHGDADGVAEENLGRRIEALIGRLGRSRPVAGGTSPMPILLLIPGIRGNDSEEQLVAIGKPAVPYLVPLLTEKRRPPLWRLRRRVFAVEILGKIGDREAVPAIIGALGQNRHDTTFVRAAVKSLGKLKDERALPVLRDWIELLAIVDDTVRRGKKLPPDSPQDAKWWIEDGALDSIGLVWVVGEAVGTIGGERAFQLLQRLATSESEGKRYCALFGLARFIFEDGLHSKKALALLKNMKTTEKSAEIRFLLKAILKDCE